ncbi:Anti-sigma factor N-terminus [Seinonella peptonophila]|uniref:Anti-sigma factor N-terminus n=1 Tax=Seinonella peptonophila TaxID=112248 RepID=A0A1M5AKR8_9BACL|nr:anti-sigma factor domain-containing protein [Seinonella peptonophila]SHF30823.1 Anti-sigma factor N-terminus [Seinonella peptonophila]
MQRGIVVEIQAHHWVVMTPDGSFVKIPNRDPHVQMGEEVSVQPSTVRPRPGWMIYLSGVAAALIAFFFLFPYLSNNQAQAESYVYVEIKPGVEIGVNQQQQVVNVRPIHAKAAQLIKQIDWNGKSVDEVVLRYLHQAKSKGFIQKNEPLILSAVDKKGSAKKTLTGIRTKIEQDTVLGNQFRLNIFTLSMPQIAQKEAQKTGLTPGKYGVWLLSKQSGKEIPVKEVADKPLVDLTKNLSVLDHPPTEEEWSNLVKEQGDQNKPLPTLPKTNGQIEKPQKKLDKPTQVPTKQEQDQEPTKKEEQKPSTDTNDSEETNPNRPSGDKDNGESTTGAQTDSPSPDHANTQQTATTP